MEQNESASFPTEFQTREQIEDLVNSLVKTQVQKILQVQPIGVEVGRMEKKRCSNLAQVFAVAGPISLILIGVAWYLGTEFGRVSANVMGIHEKLDQNQAENNRRFGQIDGRLLRLENHLIPAKDNQTE